MTVERHEQWIAEQFELLRRALLIDGNAIVGFRPLLRLYDGESDQQENGQ